MAAESGKALTASQKFEEEARLWKETGEVGWSGLNEYGYTKLRFWLESEGARADGVSDLLWEYGETIEQAIIDARQPGWFAAFMRTRDYCSRCGENYSLANLCFCTHCDILLGYCHQFSGGKAANGNAKCPSCEMGEIVWWILDAPDLGVTFRVQQLTPDIVKSWLEEE